MLNESVVQTGLENARGITIATTHCPIAQPPNHPLPPSVRTTLWSCLLFSDPRAADTQYTAQKTEPVALGWRHIASYFHLLWDVVALAAWISKPRTASHQKPPQKQQQHQHHRDHHQQHSQKHSLLWIPQLAEPSRVKPNRSLIDRPTDDHQWGFRSVISKKEEMPIPASHGGVWVTRCVL